MASQLSSIRRARNVPVFLGIVVLGATIALELGAGRSHAAVSSQRAVSSTMSAYVHDDASIGLNFADGTGVGSQAKVPPTIPPGTYTINVVDDAYEHNFHLMGPGVDLSTPIDDVQTTTWTVTLQPGSSYRYQCDAHPDFMWGDFVTSGTAVASSGSSGSSSGSSGSSGSSSSSSGSSSSTSSSGSSGSASAGANSALIGTLIGTLSSSGKVTLTWGGLPVKKIQPGRYEITVGDKAKTRSFVLQQKGHAAKVLSSVAAVGDHTVTLSLTAGTWSFYASPGGAKSTFTVS